jgi:predicted nucleic acid-binding Zn ribbon protein
MRRLAPRPIGLALDGLRTEWEPDTLLAQVQRVWPAAVGQTIAEAAEPTAERGGVLTVACAAAVWAQELDLMAPTILERLNEALGSGGVDRLRCVALPVG